MLPLLQMTGDLGLDPDYLRMTISLTHLVSDPMPIFMIFLAAIFALLKVLKALYAPKLARAALWAYQGLAMALTLVMVANSVDISAGSDWSLGGSNGITLLDLMKHGSAAVGSYAPFAFLIYATICIALRLAKRLMSRPAARSKA